MPSQAKRHILIPILPFYPLYGGFDKKTIMKHLTLGNFYYDTPHATLRSAQRAISSNDVDEALNFGRRYRSHGRFVFCLTDRDCMEHGLEASKKRGVTAVTKENQIITVKHNFMVKRHPGVASKRAVRERAARRRLRPMMQKLKSVAFDPNFEILEEI
jgi:hypothetical protein